MRPEKLKEYLLDVIKIETEMKVAENTFHNLSVEEEKHIKTIRLGELPKGNDDKVQLVKCIAIYGTLILAVWLLWGAIKIIGDVLFSIMNSSSIGFLFGLFLISPIIVLCKNFILNNPIKSYFFLRKDVKITAIERKNNAQKSEVILQEIRTAKPMIQTVYTQYKTTRAQLYSLNIVHPKYRYLEACTMFYEYLSTGRTHSLIAVPGDQGAYNIFEDELYKKMIVDKLDQVLNNQKMLYQKLCEINRNVEILCDSVNLMEETLNKVERNTRISAWCDQANAINIYTMRRMKERYYTN